jgi:hypothetical protein
MSPSGTSKRVDALLYVSAAVSYVAVAVNNLWLLNWIIGPLWCVGWVWGIPAFVRLVRREPVRPRREPREPRAGAT